MASHHHGGGGRGGGRGQANPNVAQAGYGGGRSGQYYGDDRGGRGGGGRGGGRGFDGRGGGRGGGGHYQEGRGGGGGGGYYQEGRGGGGGGGYYQDGRGGSGRGGTSDYGRGGGQQQGGGGGRGGGGGPSHQPPPADLRQAGPPLSERYAAEAAALRERFSTMDIHRDVPMFPARPGHGAAGTPCVVRANHFFVGLVDKGLHHYDVSISPEPPLKGVYRQVMSRLVSERQQSDLGGRVPAYDGGKSLFTAGELPFTAKEFEVTLPGGGGRAAERRYTVAIKHATAVSLQQLMMLMAGRATDIPGQALQVLDIVLRDIVLNERNNMGYIAVGRSFFSPYIEETKHLGMGIEAWKGFYQSIRPTQDGLSVIVDMSSTTFIQAVPLIDFVKKVLNKDDPRSNFTSITNMDYIKLKKALRGVRIEVTHRGQQRRKYKIAGLTQHRPCDLSFESSTGVSKTITEYFREAYQLNLQYGFLPCVQAGSEQKPNYLPMEVCKIVPVQRYQKKLDENQVVERNQYNSTKRASEFGIEVDYNPTSVEARVLPAPVLKYHDSGSESRFCPRDGSWNMRNKKVVNGAKISNWACVLS